MRERSNWLTLIPLPIMLRRAGSSEPSGYWNVQIADLVDTGTCSLRKVPNGIVLLNLEQSPKIDDRILQMNYGSLSKAHSKVTCCFKHCNGAYDSSRRKETAQRK